ncbi:MAG: hypothetical protein JO061_12205, partial [Acidobacteriaceae bacterium]|nr:hypothetical protein [Acidobacteriaceae bacterium]
KNPGQYWLPGNNAQYGSALSYIPENVWNESASNGGSGLWAGGGGASIAFTKPAWQTGPGVPADGMRDVPDVSLTAASHDGYIIDENGGLWTIAGTSAAAPSFAGMVALIGQKTNSWQGCVNPTLYSLAVNQASGGASVFHDVRTGNNSVPGVTGFKAASGYDQATGLGSVDAGLLVNDWTGITNPNPSLGLSASATSLTVLIGQSGQVTLTTFGSKLSAPVSLSVSGAPANLTATLGATSVALPGSGSIALNVVASSNAAPGAYPLTVTAKSGSITSTAVITVSIPSPSFTLSPATSSITVPQTYESGLTYTVTPQNGFTASLALTVAGQPSGMKAWFVTPTLAGGSGSSILYVTPASTVKSGTYQLAITATAGALVQKAALNVTVTAPGSCTLAANPASVNVTAGQPISANITCGSVQGTFASPLNYTVTGQPAGVTATFNPTQTTAGATTALSVSADPSAAKAGTFNLTVLAQATGFSQTITVPVTVQLPASSTNAGFTVSPAAASLSLKPGASGQLTFNVAHTPGFNASVSMIASGLPAGVTVSLSRTSLAAPGDGAFTVTLATQSSVKAGSYSASITVSGGNESFTIPVAITISSAPSFTFVLANNAITVQAGGPAVPVTGSVGNYTNGFNSTIVWTWSQLGPGMNWSFLTANTANNFVNITDGITAASNTPRGTYALKLTVSGGGTSYTTIVNVTVTAPAQSSTKH